MIGGNLIKVVILVTKYFQTLPLKKFIVEQKGVGHIFFLPLGISVMKHLIKKCVGTKVFRHQIFS